MAVGQIKELTKLVCIHGGPGMDGSYVSPFLNELENGNDLVTYTQGSNGASGLEGPGKEPAEKIGDCSGSSVILVSTLSTPH